MESNVDEVLKEAAAAVNAAGPQKKERKPKENKEAKVREPKVAKPKAEKLYVQWNEDGSPMLDESGERVKLPTKMDRPKKAKGEGTPRAPRVPENGVIAGAPAACREGSKRHERNKAFEGSTTVGDFYSKGGLAKDLVRNIKSGAVTVTVDGSVWGV